MCVGDSVRSTGIFERGSGGSYFSLEHGCAVIRSGRIWIWMKRLSEQDALRRR
jgi:hypothetical protein